MNSDLCDRSHGESTSMSHSLRGSELQCGDGHQVPSRSARPPLSTTPATAARTLSFHGTKPAIPALPVCPRPCWYCDDDTEPSDRSMSITSTKYMLPYCSRGTDVDGRRSMREAGRRSAARRSETVTSASCDTAFGGSTSRRIRALRSSIHSFRVFGKGDEGLFTRI